VRDDAGIRQGARVPRRIDEAIAILKLCSMEWPELEVYALYDGDEIAPWETVLLIEGPYDAFAHLETLYLGVPRAARRSGATPPRRGGGAAEAGDVLPARHDHGWSRRGRLRRAHRGAIGVSTDAQASCGLRRRWHGAPALIAA